MRSLIYRSFHGRLKLKIMTKNASSEIFSSEIRKLKIVVKFSEFYNCSRKNQLLTEMLNVGIGSQAVNVLVFEEKSPECGGVDGKGWRYKNLL